MKTHSSPPFPYDSVIITYIVNNTVVNMPLRNKSYINIYTKQPVFKVVGIWNKKTSNL